MMRNLAHSNRYQYYQYDIHNIQVTYFQVFPTVLERANLIPGFEYG